MFGALRGLEERNIFAEPTQDTSSCGATQSQHEQSISELTNTIHLSCYRRLGELVECCDTEPNLPEGSYHSINTSNNSKIILKKSNNTISKSNLSSMSKTYSRALLVL